MSNTPTRWERIQFPLAASLTLGLAPFVPEPHIVEKLRWVFVQGGVGMAPMDVFDLFFHGAPWAWLAVSALRPLPQAHDTAQAAE